MQGLSRSFLVSDYDNYKANKIDNLAILVNHIPVSTISNKIINFNFSLSIFFFERYQNPSRS